MIKKLLIVFAIVAGSLFAASSVSAHYPYGHNHYYRPYNSYYYYNYNPGYYYRPYSYGVWIGTGPYYVPYQSFGFGPWGVWGR